MAQVQENKRAEVQANTIIKISIKIRMEIGNLKWIRIICQGKYQRRKNEEEKFYYKCAWSYLFVGVASK